MRSLFKQAFGAAAGVLLVAGSSVSAEEAAPDDAYTQLTEALASDSIAQLVFEKDMVDGFVAVMNADPDVAAIDADCPGFIDGFATAVRPVLLKSHMQDYGWYRGELTALFRKTLSEEDAAGAGAFFASPLGQKFFAQAIAGQTFDNSISEALSNESGRVSEETYEADKAESVQTILSQLSESEYQELDKAFREAAWFPAIKAIQPQMQALSLELTNKDFNEEDGAEFDAVSDVFMEQHLEKCDAE